MSDTRRDLGRGGRFPAVEFPDPAELVPPHAEYNVNYELEVTFTPTGGGSTYLLLDKDEPFTFE